jgi:hypothetical protein
MSTLAQHRRQEALLLQNWTVPTGRLKRLSIPSASAAVRRQSTLLRLVSITESNVVAVLGSALDSNLPTPRNQVADSVASSAFDGSSSSWGKMKDALDDWLNVKVTASTCPASTKVEASIQIRNAIAHGLGSLTPRMARAPAGKFQTQFALVGVTLSGRDLVISELALRTVALASREFVVWLDAQL